MATDRRMCGLLMVLSAGLMGCLLWMQYRWHSSPGMSSVLKMVRMVRTNGTVSAAQACLNLAWVFAFSTALNQFIVFLFGLVVGGRHEGSDSGK